MNKFLALMLLSIADISGAAAATTDNFFADDTLSGKWTIASGNPASKVAVISTLGLLLQASARNGGSDLFNGTNFNAPMVLQAINPALDWTVTASVSFNDCFCQAGGGGIVLATKLGGFTDNSQFLRILERARTGTQNILVSDTYGSAQTYTNVTADNLLLRVRKIGATYTTSYSLDGQDFITLVTFSDSRSFSYIGLESIRQPYDNGLGRDQQTLFTDFELFFQ